jgi:hypothetical protein
VTTSTLSAWRRGVFLSICFVGIVCAPLSALKTNPSDELVFRSVTVIDGTGKPAKTNMAVRVRSGKIVSVESGRLGSQPGAKVVDGNGKYLIPGLWDMHVHMSDIGEVAFPILVTYGVTSVRDMGGDPEVVRSFRDRIEQGSVLGPRVRFCGPMLEGKWEQKPGARTDHWTVATTEEANAVVKRLAAEGVDCIKMRSYANAQVYFALAAAAAEHHLPLAGHAPWGIDPIESSNAGQRSYEHAFYPWPWSTLSNERKKQIEDTFRKNSSMVVPTLVAWETFRFDTTTISEVVNDTDGNSDPRLRQVSPSLRKNWKIGVEEITSMKPGTPGWNKAIDDVYEQVAEMHERGVGIMTGTDTGSTMVYPGASLQQELKLLVTKCRFSPMDALLAATIMPAKFFHMDEQAGTIEPGKVADMVLLSANPLDDIGNVQKIEGVMLGGQWLDRTHLNEITRATEAAIKAAYTIQH